MIIWIAPVLLWLSGKAQDYIDFLRSIPGLIAPKPTTVGAPYNPPFSGGQSVGVSYRLRVDIYKDDGTRYSGYPIEFNRLGRINPFIKTNTYNGQLATPTDNYQLWWDYPNEQFSGSNFEAEWKNVVLTVLGRTDGLPDTGGNAPNPNPNPSIADDGLFNPTNPLIANDDGVVNSSAIVLAPAFPLALVAAVLAGYTAAMQAAQAAASALEAIKKIAEGLEALKDLWEKLKEFLNEWEKNRPKKRDTIRQTYGQLVGDGALDFFPSNNQRYQSVQLDIVITTIPIGFGKYFGSFSPHRYRYKELGYIAFYSTTQGILELRTLEFKRTTLEIPKLAVGFIYHLGLNDRIKGYAFGTFSVEKP